MSASTDDILGPLGIAHLISDREFDRDPATGVLRNPAGLRVVGAPPELLRSLRLVLEKENSTAWQSVSRAAGKVAGRAIAARLDAELTRIGKPTLPALPLEACLLLIERYLALHGWGNLKFDLTDTSDHGIVLARLTHSCFAEALPEVDDFVDPALAGVLQGLFEHVTGQALGCAEAACARHASSAAEAAPGCTFIITDPERLATVSSLFGHEPIAAILARLKT
jgi:hypothetical protein